MTEIANALQVDPARKGTERLASALKGTLISPSLDDSIRQPQPRMPAVRTDHDPTPPKVVVKPGRRGSDRARADR